MTIKLISGNHINIGVRKSGPPTIFNLANGIATITWNEQLKVFIIEVLDTANPEFRFVLHLSEETPPQTDAPILSDFISSKPPDLMK